MDQVRILNHYGLNKFKNHLPLYINGLPNKQTLGTYSSYRLMELDKNGRELRRLQINGDAGAVALVHEYMHFLDHAISSELFTTVPTSGLGSVSYTLGFMDSNGNKVLDFGRNYMGSKFEDFLLNAIDELKKVKNTAVKFDPGLGYQFTGQEILARFLQQALTRSDIAKQSLANLPEGGLKRAVSRLVADTNMDRMTSDAYSDDTVNELTRKLFKILEDSGVKETQGASKAQRQQLKQAVKDAITKTRDNIQKQSELEAQIERATERMKTIGKDFFERNKFVQDMGGSSPLGRFLGDKIFKYINPRTLGVRGTPDAGQINGFAVQLRDRENMLRGMEAYYRSEAGRITRFLKKYKFTDEQVAKIPYIIEGEFPGGQTIDEFLKDVPNSDKLIEAANQFSDMLDKIGINEVRAGALKATRKGYFPHAMLEDPAAQKEVLKQIRKLTKYNLIGRDALNKFASQRNSFKTFAEWDDAIATAKKKLELILDPDKYQEAEEALKSLENLFERNVFTAMERRFVKSARSVAMTNLYRDFEKSGAIIKKENLVGKNLKGYKMVDDAIAKSLKYVQKGDYINENILEGLGRMDTLFSDKGFQKFVDGFTSLTNIFKSGVTTYIPRHYLFNAIGNLANNIMAGVTPRAYQKAASLMYKQRNGLLTPAEERIMKMAYEDGILTGGSTTDVADPYRLARLEKELEANGGVSPLNKLAKVERAVADNRYAHTMSQMGHITDNLARLAHYVEMMKKTGSRRLSRESVRKYLYNYSELTNTDKYIKLFAPFWSFTKNNLPRMLMEFAKQPRFFLTYEKMRDQMDRGGEKPDYLDGLFGALNVGKNTYWNPRLPQEQLSQIEDPYSFGMNMLSPYMKAPFEVAANKQFYNNAPIDPYRSELGGYSPGALSEYAIGQTGVGNEIYKLFNADARKNVSPAASAAYSVIGRPTVVDPVQVQRTKFYQMQEYLNKQAQQRLAKLRKEQGL